MNEYKIVRLTWVNGDYAFAVVYRSPDGGWTYVAKYLNEAAAKALLSEL